MWRKKVERGTEGWQGQGQCQQRQHRDEGPGLETKIIKPRSGSFRKLKKAIREISTVGLRRMEKNRKELSVCLFGLRPLRNNYSLLITIWRKETQSSGLGCLLSLWGRLLPRLLGEAPEEPHSNVITFRTPPSRRMDDFDPTARTLWPTWVAGCGLSRNSQSSKEEEEERGGQMKVTAMEVNLDLKSHRGWKIPQG